MNEPPKNPTEDKRKRLKNSGLATMVSDYGKVPPQAVDLEEAVLGAMMLEKDALASVIDILKPEVFYKESHKMIFQAIMALFGRTDPVDILTVTNELKSRGELDLVGGAYYISQLTNRVASGANIEFHSRIILQKFIQRELIRISSDIIKDAYEDTTDVFDLLDKAERNLFGISEDNFRRDYRDMQSLLKDAIQDIQTAMDHETQMRGIPSGFTELDRITSGWQRSDLVVLAARPGMGKTAFVLSMARNIAIDFKKPVVVFSLEMSAVQLVTRLISSESMLPAEKLKKGNLEPHEWTQLNTKIRALEEAPLLIDDTPALTIFELRAKARRMKAQFDIQMIVIDYIQLMSLGQDNKTNREQEISTISRSLKSLAKELDIPVIALSQLNRSVETRGGSKKPILSDLRESGAIEQDADLVLFIYRPEYYQIDEDEQGRPTEGKGDIIIAKHRNGALGEVRLQFIGKYAKFASLEETDLDDTDTYDSFSNAMTLPSKMNNMEDEEETPF